MNIVYVIRDREAGNVIDTVATREEAEQLVAAYEDEDRQNDSYTPDFYEIIEREHNTIREIRKISRLTRAKFSERYSIPVRTLENWENGVSECPEYTRSMLERIVIEDFPVNYLYIKWDLRPVVRRSAITASGGAVYYTELESNLPPDHQLVLPDGVKLVDIYDQLYLIPDRGQKRPHYPEDFVPFSE